MGLLASNQRQQWLYLTEAGIGLIQYETKAGQLPAILSSDWHAVEQVLDHPEAALSWITERCKKGTINLVLGEPCYQLLLVDVPEVPADEVESALRLKAADLISYDLDDAALDVILLPSEAYRGRLRMAFIIAALKSKLRQWALALAKEGLRLSIIDIDQLQLRNLAIRVRQQPRFGLLHFTAEHCRLVLMFNDELVLSRQFDIGYTNLSGLNEQTDSLTLEGQDDIQLESLVLELRRSFDYYESQLGLGSMSEIHLLGWPGDSRLGESLKNKLSMRVDMLLLEDYITWPDSENPPASWQLPVIGCLFRGASS